MASGSSVIPDRMQISPAAPSTFGARRATTGILAPHRQHEYIFPIKYNGGSIVSLSSSIGLVYNAAPQPLPEAGARQLGRRKARCITVRFLTPPVENRTYHLHGIRLNTCDHSPWSNHEASVPISPVPRVSTRVQLARSLGTFGSLFSQARGLR